jgi:hypothetical protein
MGLMIPIVPYVLSRNRSRSRETIRFALPARAQARNVVIVRVFLDDVGNGLRDNNLCIGSNKFKMTDGFLSSQLKPSRQIRADSFMVAGEITRSYVSFRACLHIS